MYIYKKNNSWVYPVNLSSKFNGIGAWHLKTDEERAEQEFYPLVSINSVATPRQIRSTFADIVLDEGICTATYTLSEKSLRYYQNEKILEAKELRDTALAARPAVASGLGFSVDGSPTDIQYLEIGKRLELLFVVDSEGIPQPIVSGDWDTILDAVAVYRLSILQKYWDYKTEIEACTTLEEVEEVKWL